MKKFYFYIAHLSENNTGICKLILGHYNIPYEMRNFIFAILISFAANAQLENLSPEELEQKIQLDTKVQLSKNYFNVSAIVLFGGLLLKSLNKDWAILGASGSLAATGTTSYYLGKHLIYVAQRNKFYKQHNLTKKKKRFLKKA